MFNKVSKLSGRIAHVNTHVKHLERDANHLAEAFDGAERERYVSGMEEQLAANMSRVINGYACKLERMEDGFFALKEHRLHPIFLPPEALLEIKEYLDSSRKTNGMTPAIELDRDILNLPVSYVQGEKELLVLLHVPYVANGETMLQDLYKAEAAVFKQGGESERLVRLHPAEAFLSIDRTWSHYQAHTAGDLASCHRLGDLYLCQDSVLLKKPTTCVAVLFLQKTQEVLHHCQQEEISEGQPVIHLYENTYRVATNVSITRLYPGREPYGYPERTATNIEIPHGCSLASDEFEVAPVRHEEETKTIPHREIIEKMVGSWTIELPPLDAAGVLGVGSYYPNEDID
jgi:hypothetical protein